MRPAVLLFVGLFGLAACGSSDEPTTVVEPAGAKATLCLGTRSAPPKHHLTALHRAAFENRRFQASRYRHGRLFAKVGLWLRGSGTTTFHVHRPARIKGWPDHAPTRRLAIRQATGCGWRAWPGGFLFPKPRRCIGLIVEADDRSAVVRLGLGKAC